MRREQVLSTLSLVFPLFEPSNTLARDCLIIFAAGVVFKLLFVALFLSRTANATLAPPATKLIEQEERVGAGESGADLPPV